MDIFSKGSFYMAFNFLELCHKKDTEGSDVEVCVRVTVVFGYLLGEVSLIFSPFCLTMKHNFFPYVFDLS